MLIGGDGHPSGVPRHIRHLVAALNDHARITVASEANRGGYNGLQGVRHQIVPGLSSRLSPVHLWRGWVGLGRLLHSEHPDIVWLHARMPVLIGRLMMVTRRWLPGPGTRVAITYHGLPFGAGHKRGFAGLSRRIEKLVLSACPALDLVFLSQAQATEMQQAMGEKCFARHRVHVLPNSSDLGALPALSGPRALGRHLVMTGRCGWQKNYPLALRLFSHLPGDFTLTLCGSGTQSDRFQAEAARILSAEALARVQFAGPVSDVRPILVAADGYLLTSRYEGLPIGALEAFEAGLPIILNRFQGAEDLAVTHPMALCLNFQDLPADAAQVAGLIDRYCAARAPAEADIRGAWQKHWSFDNFAAQARALLSRLTKDAF